jgi:NAD(P) transhydrogenase subunit alpha
MPDLWSSIFVFILAAFLGLEVIKRVSPLLHTPLMSLTNAISAIAVIGAIEIAGEQRTTLSTWLGFLAVILATSNIVGGFMITDRMLKMFKEKTPRAAAPSATPAKPTGTGGAAS